MVRDVFFVTLFFVLLAVAVIHILGNAYFLYWKIWWLDTAAHFGGGFWAGGMILWGYKHFSPRSFLGRRRVFHAVLLSLFGAFVIGAGWETFEVLIDAVSLPSEYYFSDMVTDLIFNALGALSAAIYFLWGNHPQHAI